MGINKKSYWRNSFFLDKLLKKLVLKNRYLFLKYFSEVNKIKKKTKILDVGTVPSLERQENLILEKYKNNKITCLSNVNCKILKKKFKNLKILVGDGRIMKIKSNSFDIVHSNATIEHVGSETQQLKFLKECIRVSKNSIFITTPNRYYPVDFHTKKIFLHFLPKKMFRNILLYFGDKFFSKEENLNLLSDKDLIKLIYKTKIKNYIIKKHKFLFLTSNFLIQIYKK